MFDPSIVVSRELRLRALGSGAYALIGVFEGEMSFFPGRNIEGAFESAIDVVEPGVTIDRNTDIVIDTLDDSSLVRDVK